MTEIAVYGLLAAAVAAGLLIAGGQPAWYAAAVVVATLFLLGVLALAAGRAAGRDSTRPDEPSGTGARRRRRKH
ncbi:hypothetical protein G1H11_13665 [Phytoactinopolyspora alkaliphila]|uniref:Uncharacterized protein n=1 Tax=Phytoactinopolyspora alkaliphila TaxID=1783498 RepID=A0A6N9YMZ7_9ACTN|nr:hypothetical protein [Phytoactinopolyspora alkaliphila]NED96354.1 hypothetical protein [Phytoactinopolyspora alkaliphila]